MKNNTIIHVESSIRLFCCCALKSKYVLDKFDALTLHCACTVKTQAYSCLLLSEDYDHRCMTFKIEYLLLIHQLDMNHGQCKAILNLLYIIIN